MQDLLTGTAGVSWARVDVVTRRVVVRFDPQRLNVDEIAALVVAAENAAGVCTDGYRHHAPSFPGDDAPVALQAWALAADVAGLSAAIAGRLTRVPSLPGSAAAVGALIDNQPRLRGALETRVGPAATDLTLAVTNAAVLALSLGAPSLVVETGQRTQALLASRSRRAAFTVREAELCGLARPVPDTPLERSERPVPLPAGPVEQYADKAATGSLLVAGGLLVARGSVDLAGRVMLIGAPKAARQAREAFADTLSGGLSRRGHIVMDPSMLRRLDRIDSVIVDSRVLHEDQLLVVSARAEASDWTDEHVWSAAQRLLSAASPLPIPPPRGRSRRRLRLIDQPTAFGAGLSACLLVEDDRPVGEVVVGTELSPFADAVLTAIQTAGLRLVLTRDAAAPELASRAYETLDDSTGLARHVRRLQGAGSVVALVSADEAGLAAADVGIGVIPRSGRVPWAAHVLCGPGLQGVPRLLAAVPVARSVSTRGVTSAKAATFLGGLLTAVGGPGRTARAVLPVTAAAGAALISGTIAARRLDRLPPPEPVLHSPWHAFEADEVWSRLAQSHADESGSALAPGSRHVTAAGLLKVPAAVLGPWVGLARNVRAELADPLTPVLATGAAASAVIGSPVDALLVGGVLAANALVSGAQRMRADSALRELLAGQQPTARVVIAAANGETLGSRTATEPTAVIPAPRNGHARRNGRTEAVPPVRLVPANALRPGDVIDLRAGDVVPADARLLTEHALEVDEASLTGESIAVGKQTQATPGADLVHRACMVYEGTIVVAGTGQAVVVAVGSATEAGRALALAAHAGAPPGMQARLEELTSRGLPVTLLGGAGVTGLSLLRGQPLRRAIASGVSVAVAAVPEGLPLVATVAQLGAARRLSSRGVLVRSARTVEALGRVDTVCFDKTGTLTEGRPRLARVAGPTDHWPADAPQGRRVLLDAARACPQLPDGQNAVHATDRAILDAERLMLGDRRTFDDWTALTELPFQSDRGFSAALGRTSDKVRLVVKGAPEILLPRCTHERDDDGKRRLDSAGRRRATALVNTLAGQGLRVLAVARRNVTEVSTNGSHDSPSTEMLAEDLTLLGFVALADIPRPQAASTIRRLQSAGVDTIMITGDHPATAKATARGLGIAAHRVVTGPQLAAVDEQARIDLVLKSKVFARVSPEQKLRIVSALQRAGRVVAMTGDGANDAAAIRLADVGIGMAAHGSTSARSAADLVLTDTDVSLIVEGLIEGRAMWGRVRDAVGILLGGNAGEVAFTLAGTALAGRAPIGTRQFLLVNMLTDLLPAMAIALAATPEDAADRQRLLTGEIPSLGAPLLRDIAVRGAATSAGALAAWQIGRFTGTRRRASTMALAALVGTQLGQTLLVGRRNPVVLVTGIGSAATLATIIQVPGLSRFFGSTPLDPFAWVTVAGCAAGATVLSSIAPRLLPSPANPAGTPHVASGIPLVPPQANADTRVERGERSIGITQVRGEGDAATKKRDPKREVIS